MQQENKMGVMPVNRLIITMSLPMIVAMLVTALYNVVDSIFVARISEKALTAVSLSHPEPDDCHFYWYWCWYQCTFVYESGTKGL